MPKNKKIFKIDAGKLFAFSLILLALTTAFSCSSPLIGKSQNAKADFTLNFIISGSSRDAVAKSLAENATTSAGNEAQSASRLILTTAKTLVVSLTPKDASIKVPEPQIIQIDSGLSALVSFTDIIYGEYTIKADAFAEDGTTVRFTQTAVFKLDSSKKVITLNLVPANYGNIPELSSQSIAQIGLAIGIAKTYVIQADSPILKSKFLTFGSDEQNILFYLQKLNGELLGEGRTASDLIYSGNIAESVYVTFYNKTEAAHVVGFCTSPEVVTVPAGAFQRDGTATNISYVSEFSLGKYEVTQAQYLAIMGENPSSSTTSSSYVVDNINFYRAITFCNKLSLLEGLTPVYSVIKSGSEIDWSSISHADIPISTESFNASDNDWNAVSMNLSANGYRLPTEMEWRWAAMGATEDVRGGDIVNEVNVLGYTKGYAGSTESGNLQTNIGNYARYQANTGVGDTITEPRTIQPVGTKSPNELGIYDMSGNVWEWCWDVLDIYPSGPLTNYTGSSNARDGNQTSMFVGAGFDDTTWLNPGDDSSLLLNHRANIDRKPQDGPPAVGFRIARNSKRSAVLYTANNNGTIGAYKISEENGNLEKLSTYDKGADSNPLYVVMVHPNRKFLYAIGRDGSTSSIYTYTINPFTGDLAYVSASAKVTGTDTCQILIDPTGNYLYTCNSQNGGISILKIDSNGTLTLVEQNFSLGLSGSIPLRMAMTPDGKYLYTANYSESENVENLSMLSINASNGSLTPISGSPLEVFTKSANNLIISPDGKYLYVSEYNGCIEQFEINADGSLISKQILTGRGWQNYLYIDPSARFLYFCTYGFYGVARNTSTGAMTYLNVDFSGSKQTDRDGLLVFAPYGNWAYSNTTNTIELFSHNNVNGALQFVRDISTTEQVNDLTTLYLY